MLTQKHAIEEYLRSGGGGTLFVTQGARKAEGLVSLAREHGVPVKVISPNRLKRLAPRAGSWCFHEERREERRPDFEEWLQSRGDQESLLILLDHVTDPHNLGAVLRSCDQFGADLVVLPERRSAGLGGVVADTSAGAVEHVPVSMVPNLANALVRLQDAGFWVYAAHMEGSPLWKVRFPTKTAVILGSEGKGVSELLKKRSDELVAIPRYGEIDSLNVSVA
ncbi:MAG: 23S rRNA (guanosine(2251)-2'-O)-methyltransferase RlmB, partial [Alkalispirochaetaceae bacterium]